jgi:hypothetical protein
MAAADYNVDVKINVDSGELDAAERKINGLGRDIPVKIKVDSSELNGLGKKKIPIKADVDVDDSKLKTNKRINVVQI